MWPDIQFLTVPPPRNQNQAVRQVLPFEAPKNVSPYVKPKIFFVCLFVIVKHKKGTVLSAFIKARLGFRLKFFCVTDPNVSTA